MDADPKPAIRSKLLIALIVIILIGIVFILKIVLPILPLNPVKTLMPNIVDRSGSEQSSSTPGKTGRPYGILVNLSEGQEQFQTPEPLPVSTGEPLTEDEVVELFSRLPVLPVSPEEQAAFRYPVELLPPPRPGKTIEQDFPPSDWKPTPEMGPSQPLEVIRFAPEGEIPIAPFVSVTFNQPMVALGTLDDLDEETVPVKIDPQLPGTWRWLGTRTLTFEYDSDLIDRLPKATIYTVTIPAGIKSASGADLPETISWSFSTPPPKVVEMYPRDIPQPLHPLIFIAFDQRIKREAVLNTIQVYAANQQATLRLATADEISQDKQISQRVKGAQEGRWLVLKAVQPFAAATSISVTVGPGTPSAEGPLVTTSPQSFGFTTYSPFRVDNYGCYWSDSPCPPMTPFSIRFNNPIDSTLFTDELVSVTPKIPGMVLNVYENTLMISGETKAQTTYTVTLSSSLVDVFSQKLGKEVRLTFKVGKAETRLYGPDNVFITLDPAQKKPVFSVYAINYEKLAVKIYSVEPNDWFAFTKFKREWRQSNKLLKIPGDLVYDETVLLNNPEDTLSEVKIELAPYLDGSFGHLIVVVEPPTGMFESEDQKWNRFYQTIHAWVQVTHIGVDAYTDYSDMVVWTTDLKDGSPLSGISIQPNIGGKKFTTGADGTARFAIPSGAMYLTASKGTDSALLLHSNNEWEDYGWQLSAPADSLHWYVFDDRHMYRPGEEVHLKGWLRRVGGKQNGDVNLVGKGVTTVTYQLTDPQGNQIGTGETDVNAFGGFDFTITIPGVVNLGYAQLNLSALGDLAGLNGNLYNHSIQIQEFRRPEFEVSAHNETSGPYFAGGSALISVKAKYYTGDALPNAAVDWEVTTTPGHYAPPNWQDFVFGEWIPWWRYYECYDCQDEDDDTRYESFTGLTDAFGMHYLKLGFDQQGEAEDNPRPMSVSAEATVMDVNRQAWASTTSLLVHPANLYVGLRSDRYFVARGTPIKIDFIVTDLDGLPLADQPVLIKAARLEWKLKDGTWNEEEVDTQECSKKSKSEPDSCTFETPIGGSYRITATVTDEQGRKNQTRFTRWVSGGQQPPARKVEQEEVTLIPDKETYQPGDTAQILVQSPFSPAEGLLTVSRSGFLYTQRFTIKDGSTTLSVPIEVVHIPNLNLQVDLVGSAPRTDDKGEILKNVTPRPAFATGQLKLSIPPLQHKLSLQVKLDESQIEPGGNTTVRILLKDGNGKAVPDAELAVVVVDEAILALTNYQLADPLSIFYRTRESGIFSVYSRDSIILANPKAVAEEAVNQLREMDGFEGARGTQIMDMAVPMVSMEKSMLDSSQQTSSISVRTDFNPLAAFAPTVRTSSNGEATVYVKVPDNLTRYRVMVVAVDKTGTQFGTGESNLTARLPLMVRPSAPRFLNFGDKFELPVVLQNQTDAELIVDVVARATNLELAISGLRVVVPAHNRIEVHFPASTEMAGTARIQVAAVSGNYADAAVVELPVFTPTTTEAFATYGVIDAGAIAQPVLRPTNVFPQFGGLEISTSSTALQALTDAVLYLAAYPYECSEQLASRVLAIAALRDVLSAFEADGLPTPEELEAAVIRDIDKLQGMQNEDGGYPYWRRGFESVPFNTIHVTHALYRASQKGYVIPKEMQQASLKYLSDIESHYPYWYSEQTRRTLSSYALHVRNLWGDRDPQKAQDLLMEAGVENLTMEAIGWLWPVIDNETQLVEIRRFVTNHVVETAGAANFTTAYDDQTYLLLSSDRRTDAILLDGLMEDDPQSDLIVKLVNGLLVHRTKGRWENTQENVFVLLALDRYFNTYETQTPDFVARLWLGDTYAGSNEFVGRSIEQYETLIPMHFVLSETAAAGGTQDLIISKEGPGRLYYRLGLKYAPTDLNLDALDAGFVVQRRYEALDDPDDVSQDDEGIWHIKAGARVKVHITMVADNRRYHVALVDPLPAGLEIINPALAVSPNVPDEDPTSRGYGWWWWGTWYEHQNLRDDRAEVFTSLLWDGVYEYSYTTRATTPGTFIAPPAKAEEMYSPEVFGRSNSDRVIIK